MTSHPRRVAPRNGAAASRWQGQCADCAEWNTLVEEAPLNATPFQAKHNLQSGGRAIQLVGLDAEVKLPDRMATGIAELDRALGGGFVEASATLIGGDPGIGKSTLLLQTAANLARRGLDVAYISGEEAVDQVRLRARRLAEEVFDRDKLAEKYLEILRGVVRKESECYQDHD